MANKTKVNSIDDCLTEFVNDAKTEGVLANKIRQLQNLDNLLKNYLGEELASHFQVINYRDHCLVLVVEQASWATKIRYQVPQLLAALQQQEGMTAIQDIHCLVRPAIKLTQTEPTRRILSPGVKALADVAKGIQNPELKAALLNLAKLG